MQSRSEAIVLGQGVSALWRELAGWVAVAKLRVRTEVGAKPTVMGAVWVHGDGRIRLGDRVVLDGRACPIELHATAGGEIVIGDEVYIEPGVSIEARESVRIGNRARLGRHSKILDNQFHPLRGDRHEAPPSEAVVVEHDAQLGPMTVVLPGAHVPPKATVPPGKVVSRSAGARGRPAGKGA